MARLTVRIPVEKHNAPAAPVNQYARQAIVTRYAGPTNTRGARIIATASAGRVVVPYDYSGEAYDNHVAAALALADRFDWGGQWAGGAADGVYVFVNIA